MLGACASGLTKLVILEKGTRNHDDYINKILPIALKCGTDMMGDNWMFQQDGASPHKHKKTHQWCKDNFPAFLPYDRWPANSPDLNHLDYSIWNELVQNMDWGRISTKSTLVRELKLAVKKKSIEFLLHSIDNFTLRLRQILTNKGDYID